MSIAGSLPGWLLRRGLLVLLLALGACGENDPTPIVADNSSTMSLTTNKSGSASAAAADYKLGPNDRTRIIVYGQPNLTGEFVLDGNGVPGLPADRQHRRQGMTPTELQRAIASQARSRLPAQPQRQRRRSPRAGRSTSSARCRSRAAIPTSPT
jgi:polysaccharide export outer membrane protein